MSKTKGIFYVVCPDCEEKEDLPDWAKGSEWRILNFTCKKCGHKVSNQIQHIQKILDLNTKETP